MYYFLVEILVNDLLHITKGNNNLLKRREALAKDKLGKFCVFWNRYNNFEEICLANKLRFCAVMWYTFTLKTLPTSKFLFCLVVLGNTTQIKNKDGFFFLKEIKCLLYFCK